VTAKPLTADLLYDILHRADLEHDSSTGGCNNDRVIFLEEALLLLGSQDLLTPFVEALVEKFAGIDHYQPLHQFCYLDVLEEMRRGDCYYLSEICPTSSCYYFPRGWCDMPHEGVEHEVPEVWGYAPLGPSADSEVDLMWVPLSKLRHKKCSEELARRQHPKLFEHLETINKET